MSVSTKRQRQYGTQDRAVDPVVRLAVAHLEKVTGLIFEEKDLPGVEAKLARRAAALGLGGLSSYADFIRTNLGSETVPLIGLLTTHHTAFFREFVHFQELERILIPGILEHSGRRNLKLWSAAASRGHEAYSLAMFLEHVSPRLGHFEYSILATDIDPESVGFGQNGVYPVREVHQSPALYLAQHWARGRDDLAGWVKARASLRRRISWATGNLLQQSSMQMPHKMDVIFCRNVFLYFSREQIAQVMRNMILNLEPWGVIALGVCENLQDHKLPVVPLGHSLFVPEGSPHLKRGSGANGSSGSRQEVLARQTGTGSAGTRSQHMTGNQLVQPEAESRIIRVIAVDDSPTVLALLKKVLVPNVGFEIVATAKNLADARSAVALHGAKVDLMTLDLHLGNETGIDYLKSIQGKGSHVPIVVVSALNRESEGLAREALALGAVDYVEKPEGANLERMGQELRAKLSTALATTPGRSGARGGAPGVVPEARATEITVVVVDDSPTMIKVLTQMITSPLGRSVGPVCRVVATVSDPRQLVEVLRKHKPDVMTLDMNMPGFNGVEALRQLPADLNVPAVVVSSLGLEQGSLVLDALALGAVDYFPKPSLADLAKETPALLEKLEIASRVGLLRRQNRSAIRPRSVVRGSVPSRNVSKPRSHSSDQLILIGASTGGTEAIRELLQDLPLECPPIAIVQHIPPIFSAAFAQRLQDVCGRPVSEVKDGELLLPGHAYVAPGDRHFVLRRGGSGYVAGLLDTPKHGGHRPSVDVLFDSAAQLRGASIIAALLTGMGKDGAEGLLKLRMQGARTICQSERSCVVFGMPRAGIELGAAEFVDDLSDAAKRVAQLLLAAAA